MDIKELTSLVGQYCRQHREKHLQLNITEFCMVTDLNIKTVSAFERGQANNIKYLFYYYNMSDEEGQEKFSKELFKIL